MSNYFTIRANDTVIGHSRQLNRSCWAAQQIYIRCGPQWPQWPARIELPRPMNMLQYLNSTAERRADVIFQGLVGQPHPDMRPRSAGNWRSWLSSVKWCIRSENWRGCDAIRNRKGRYREHPVSMSMPPFFSSALPPSPSPRTFSSLYNCRVDYSKRNWRLQNVH